MTGLVPREPPKSLSGPEKVAAVLLSLDQDIAQRVLRHFEQDDLRRLARHATGLGHVDASVLEPLFADLLEQLSIKTKVLVGSADKAVQMLAGVVPPEAAAEIMSEVLGNSNPFFWRRFSVLPDTALAAYLAEEHPQTVASVVGKLDDEAAARVLGLLPEELRNGVMRRMLVSRPVSDTAWRILEATLQEDFFATGNSDSSSDATSRVAGIINQMEREQIEAALLTIESAEPALAQELRGLLFSFEDLPKLSERARAILFDQIATERLILALRGADDVVKGAVLPFLGARVRRMVEAELSGGDMPPQRDIAQARRAIADAALKLSQQGLIEISPQEASEGNEF